MFENSALKAEKEIYTKAEKKLCIFSSKLKISNLFHISDLKTFMKYIEESASNESSLLPQFTNNNLCFI